MLLQAILSYTTDAPIDESELGDWVDAICRRRVRKKSSVRVGGDHMWALVDLGRHLGVGEICCSLIDRYPL